ncbi:MAG: aminotransferase class I/II-fold pyridoxal phosphate-dependent enzyme [Candidatus Bathyarchaeota archaeon]|nr:aminotransferase class I/II-fold pyridoxal phosphate-dependent enzyme [Candidatus Bathyarchaeota archaeon]
MYNEDIFNSMTIEGMLAGPGIKWHRDPPDVIPLWLADPDFPTAPGIKKMLLNAVHDEDFLYGVSAPALEAMAEKVKRVNRLDVTRDNVMITQGVIPGMWLAVRHACREGDEVIVTNPMYGPFYTSVEVTRTRPVYWKLDMDEGYRFNIERLKELVTPKTRLIFVCNPHNPCGRVMTEEELKGIADVAVDNKIYVMVDELWEDIVYDGRRHIGLASLNPEIADLTMTSWGFSKTWGVAGLQLGYLVATNDVMMESLRNLARGVMRGASTLAMAAAPVMLGEGLDYWKRDMIRHLEKIRELCYKRFAEMGGITVPELQGTYLMFPKFDYGKTSDELDRFFFEEARVRLNPGSHFGTLGEGHMRVLMATSEAIMNEALDRIERALAKLK